MNDEFPVNEHFFSVQGEGTHSGKTAYFLRFGGCNLRCNFCDSKNTWTKFKFLTKDTIFSLLEKAKNKTNFLVLTGGEPSLYNLTEIVKFAKRLKFYIAVETNGILIPTWFKSVDWITISPKTIIKHKNIRYADELKFVITGIKSWNFMLSYLPFKPVFLMPVNNNKKIAKFIIKKLSDNPELSQYVKLGIQMHKVYKIK